MCAPPCPIQSPYQSPIAADWNPSKVVNSPGLPIPCPSCPTPPVLSPSSLNTFATFSNLNAQPYTREFQLVLSDKGIETLMKELETQRVLKLYDASNNPPPHGTLTWPPTEKEDSTQQRPGASMYSSTIHLLGKVIVSVYYD